MAPKKTLGLHYNPNTTLLLNHETLICQKREHDGRICRHNVSFFTALATTDVLTLTSKNMIF